MASAGDIYRCDSNSFISVIPAPERSGRCLPRVHLLSFRAPPISGLPEIGICMSQHAGSVIGRCRRLVGGASPVGLGGRGCRSRSKLLHLRPDEIAIIWKVEVEQRAARSEVLDEHPPDHI